MHKIKSMAQFIFLRVISGLISISMIVLSIEKEKIVRTTTNSDSSKSEKKTISADNIYDASSCVPRNVNEIMMIDTAKTDESKIESFNFSDVVGKLSYALEEV